MGIQFKRVVILLLDSMGVGELPDAAYYGDQGSNTLGNLAQAVGGLNLSNFQKLGLGNLTNILGVTPRKDTKAFYGKMIEQSKGKDTTSGHWEIAGLLIAKAFQTFPQGFPKELMDAFTKETGYEYLGNYAASGTEIIQELGEKHLQENKLIVYTSGDSVFQIAAHESIVPVEKLYKICTIARKLCDHYSIGRVIARPFIGTFPSFTRTHRRWDFSMPPPSKTVLDYLKEEEFKVIGVGKIDNIFANCGITDSIHTESNDDGIKKTLEKLNVLDKGLLFTNLVDFDMLWGHRNDCKGYKKGLEEFDLFLPKIINKLEHTDLLIITADHGCDPTTPSTDHSREYVPVIAYTKHNEKGKDLGIRKTFADIGKTIDENFELNKLQFGTSFLSSIVGS